MRPSLNQGLLVTRLLVIWSSILFNGAVAWHHTGDPVVDNANHIFNAIHGAMRQWDSSLNYNGMSLFVATVPQGTELYHGGLTDDLVQGPEWLAFETDHAMNFARIPMNPGSLPQIPPGRIKKVEFERDDGQSSIRPGSQSLKDNIVWMVPGFFHRYAAKHDLRLLYIDGSSAAKGSKGTLDSTDYLILNQTLQLEDEVGRARGLCDLAANEWSGLIEGFIRMESGFEVIMCSFDRSLDHIDVKVAPDIDLHAKSGAGYVFHWLRGAAARYDGIGGSPRRVMLNFDNFITAYAYPVDLFQHSTRDVPRLPLPGTRVLDQMRQDLKEAIMASSQPRDPTEQLHDWSAVTAMIVQDYAAPLQYLVTSDRFAVSGIALAEELYYMTRAFINHTGRDARLEIARCAAKYIPHKLTTSPAEWNKSSTALRAIHTVSRHICTVLVETMWTLPSLTTLPQDDMLPNEQISRLSELIADLRWAEWKKCRGCQFSEICLVPMFPFGSWEDYHHPRCKGADDVMSSVGDFWSRNDS